MNDAKPFVTGMFRLFSFPDFMGRLGLVRNICIFLFTITFIGCDFGSKENAGGICDIKRIEVFSNVSESALSSDLLSDVEYIILERTPNSVIGKIDKLIITDDYIFVMDVEHAKKLFQFDSNGRFIKIIGGFGRGPGEYQQLVDFTVCDITNRILAIDINRKLVVFDKQGELIKELIIDQGDPMSCRVLMHNESIYFFTGRGENYSSEYSLIKLNFEGGKTDGYLEFETGANYSVTFNTPLYIKDGSLKLFDYFEGVLLRKEQEQFIPEYVLDFNNKMMPVEILCNIEKYIKNLQNYSIIHRYFIEGSDYIYYSVIDKMQYKHGFFSKTTGESVIINSIINDEHIFRSPEVYYSNYYYAVIETFWLFDEVDKFQHIIENHSIDPDGNALIMKFKLQKIAE
ncbi:6-bladed beta-propeller [Natronoflexus pectinivorans]|nr:6-bladed beta-propeller [Natronoflexus pectinivorans]